MVWRGLGVRRRHGWGRAAGPRYPRRRPSRCACVWPTDRSNIVFLARREEVRELPSGPERLFSFHHLVANSPGALDARTMGIEEGFVPLRCSHSHRADGQVSRHRACKTFVCRSCISVMGSLPQQRTTCELGRPGHWRLPNPFFDFGIALYSANIKGSPRRPLHQQSELRRDWACAAVDDSVRA